MVVGPEAAYGLRTRIGRSRIKQIDVEKEDLSHPAARATIAAGMRPRVLTKSEMLVHAFRTATGEYLEARNLILLKWDSDVTHFLSEQECVGESGGQQNCCGQGADADFVRTSASLHINCAAFAF